MHEAVRSLKSVTLEIKTLHWIFSRHHVDHKTVLVLPRDVALWVLPGPAVCLGLPRPPCVLSRFIYMPLDPWIYSVAL